MPPPKRKAIDVENPGDGSPPTKATVAKRQRVSRACDQCRAAREKCDGAQPLCFPCVSQNRPCTYEENPKKRGVQTGYIRTLELALAWVFEKIPGSEDALDVLLSHDAGRGQVMLAGKDSSAAKRLHKRWRRSRVHAEIERILSGADASQLRMERGSPSDDPSDTDGEADRASLSAVRSGIADEYSGFSPPSPDNSNNPSIQAERLPQRSGQAALGMPPMPPISPGLSRRTPPRCIYQLKLPSNHWRLLDIYFSYTHCWLPILERQEIFQTSYLYPPDDALTIPPGSPTSAAHAELWSALALAAFQDAASSRDTPLPANPSDGSGLLSAIQIYDIARQLIPSEEGPFQVHHTRALLLLGLINLGRENLRSAWILVGLAVRIFLDVGVHDWSMPGRHHHQQRFHSVLIACFFLDTILSERLGQPPHLKTEDMMDALPISENDLDEWQPWVACDGFGQTSSTSRQSRSPAYSLSTFNQLYEIFKVVSRDLVARRWGRGAAEVVVASPSLQQAISDRAPFAAFVLSPELSSSTIPSPYLVRVLFLWAGVVLDARPRPDFHLTMDVVEHHQSVFGTCAAPPFFASCLSSLANHRSFEALSQADKTRLTSLKDRFVSVWSQCGNNNDPTVHSPALDQVPHTTLYTQSNSRRASQLPAGSSVTLSVPSPSSFYINTPVPVPSFASAGQAYPPLGTPYVFSTCHGRNSLISPATTALTQETANDIDRPTLPNISTVGQSHPHQQMPPRSSFAGSSLDYDALLDDLASIDCVDRVDMDPQFMANLGFAPGCDLTEILSHDFEAW